jgi:hypothetical protein
VGLCISERQQQNNKQSKDNKSLILHYYKYYYHNKRTMNKLPSFLDFYHTKYAAAKTLNEAAAELGELSDDKVSDIKSEWEQEYPKQQKKKDGPKKPLTPFFRYRKVMTNDSSVKHIAPRDKSRVLGLMWKALGVEGQKIYIDEYEAEKKIYDADKVPSGKNGKGKKKPLTEEQKEEERIRENARAMAGIVRPPDARGIFIRDMQKNHPLKAGFDKKDRNTLLNTQWKALSNEEKQAFKKRHREETILYEAQLKEFISTGKVTTTSVPVSTTELKKSDSVGKKRKRETETKKSTKKPKKEDKRRHKKKVRRNDSSSESSSDSDSDCFTE